MWRVLEQRWRARWWIPLALCGAGWLVAFVVGATIESWRDPLRWSALACADALVVTWIFLRIVAVLDQREDRFALHAGLPIPLLATARARVADPVPALGIALASCLSGLSLVHLGAAEVPIGAYATVVGGALFFLIVEQLGFAMEEVTNLFPDRLVPKIAAGVVLGSAGALAGYLGARILGDRVAGGVLLIETLGRWDSILGLLGVALLLLVANRRLFVRRPDFTRAQCPW